MATSHPWHSDTINLLLVGKTGNGKSSTGNSILGKKVFVSKSSTTSVTFEPQLETSEIDGQIISVMDVPGLSDTQFDQEENVKKAIEWMNKATRLSACGFHAVVLVIRFGNRFTEEDRESIKLLKSILGNEIIRDHSVCAITCGDNFMSDVENGEIGSFKEWCAQQSGAFLDLFNECSQRCVLFDNVSKDCGIQKTQRNELIREVAQIQVSGVGTFGVREFEKATRSREKMTPRNESHVQPFGKVLETCELTLSRSLFASQRTISETGHYGFFQQWQTDVHDDLDKETSSSEDESLNESKTYDRNEHRNNFFSPQRGLNSWRYQYPLANFMDSDKSSSDSSNKPEDSDNDDDSDNYDGIDNENNHALESENDDSDNDYGIVNNNDDDDDDSDNYDGIVNNNDDVDDDYDGIINNNQYADSVNDASDNDDSKDDNNDADEDSDEGCGYNDNDEDAVEDEGSLDESFEHNHVDGLTRYRQYSGRVERNECTLL